MHSSCRSDVDVRCQICGGPGMRRLFSVPLLDGPHRADSDLKHRTIYRCTSCFHLSADYYESARFAEYYASLPDEYYRCHDDEQSRYRHILRRVPKDAKRILDIGCGTGTFLTMFSPEVERYGIEPSSAAAERARAKGVNIIRYNDLERPELRNTFDLVTAIDVLEHAFDLEELRKYLATAIRPGGTLIILTGDAQSRSARLLGRYWLYLNYSEHITFFSSRSIRRWLEPEFSHINLEQVDHHPFTARFGLSLARIWLFFPIKWLFQKISPIPFKKYAALSLPRDHMLVRAIRDSLSGTFKVVNPC